MAVRSAMVLVLEMMQLMARLRRCSADDEKVAGAAVVVVAAAEPPARHLYRHRGNNVHARRVREQNEKLIMLALFSFSNNLFALCLLLLLKLTGNTSQGCAS